MKKCIKCGEEIPEGRLKAIPNTHTCVNCSNVKIKKAVVNITVEGEDILNRIEIREDE